MATRPIALAVIRINRRGKKKAPIWGPANSSDRLGTSANSLIGDCDNRVTLRELKTLLNVVRGTEQRMGTAICWATPSHARTAKRSIKS